MNDRAVSVLSEYDFEVIRTWKGRGAILFETPEGIRILKEYKGVPEKLERQKALLDCIRENSDIFVARVVKDGNGNALGSEMVSFTVNGKKWEFATNDNGVVRFSTDRFDVGNYTVLISFEGNELYSPSSTTANIVII